ncbi:MAG TPA: hypothetical protein VMV94_08845 [Phycisphaerae bacterium]|nr:hypothetical protein [Phycisphaerae bacterium]
MTKLEAILSEASSLSAAEQLELVRFLMERLAAQSDAGQTDLEPGELPTGPESAGEEDWTPFYPVDLGDDRKTGA